MSAVLDRVDPVRASETEERSFPAIRARGLPRLTGAPVITAVAVLVGLLIRSTFVATSSFPLYDGGLFYAMVRDLERARFHLPAFTSYNSAHLPFAYPPLAFYLAGFLHSVIGWKLLVIFQYMPLTLNLAAVAAFGLLARSMLASRSAFAVSVIVFGVLPEGYRFFIDGGGLTRSIGLLFTVLALWSAHRLAVGGQLRFAALLALTGAGAVLSHPEMGLFCTYSVALMLGFFARGRKTIGYSLLAAFGALALVAPWFLSVVSRHGIGPYVSAFGRGGGATSIFRSLLQFNLTDEAWFPFMGALAFLGLLVCLGRRQYHLPAWLLVVLVLQSRDPRQEAIIPVALLAGIGAAHFLLPLGKTISHSCASENRRRAHRLGPGLFVAMCICTLVGDLVSYRPLLTGLSANERNAMAWIHDNTPTGSRFLIVTGTPGGDRSFEWFPALTQRINADPIEGYEWEPGFEARVTEDTNLQQCANEGAQCVERWQRRTEVSFRYVYIPKRPVSPLFMPFRQSQADCCWSLRNALQASHNFRVVYDGRGATVFEVRNA